MSGDLGRIGEGGMPEDAFSGALGRIEAISELHNRSLAVLHGLLSGAGSETSLETLTASAPVKQIEQMRAARSIGVVNFSPVTVYLGWGGRSASAGNGVPVAPRSWLVLPQPANILDLGASTSDLANLSAQALLIRFDQHQPLAGGPLDAGFPLADTITNAGVSAATPGPFAFITNVPVVLGAVYDVEVITAQVGTYDNLATNVDLYDGGTWISHLPSIATPITTRLKRHLVTNANNGAPAFSLNVRAQAGAGAILLGQIAATRIA